MEAVIEKNRHHLLFCKKCWKDGNAKRLRESLVFELPIGDHNDLHKFVDCVPLPPPKELARLTRERFAMPYRISLRQAFQWLLSSAEDEKFIMAIARQYVFLSYRGLL